MSRVNQLYSNDVDHLNLGVCLPLKMICQISDVYFWTDKMFYSSELKTLIVKEQVQIGLHKTTKNIVVRTKTKVQDKLHTKVCKFHV